MEYQNQLERIGAQKLFESHQGLDETTFDNWEDLNEHQKQYWIKVYNQTASEIRKLSQEDSVSPANNQLSGKAYSILSDIDNLKADVEEVLRARAALKFLKTLYEASSMVDGKDVVIQDIIYGDVNSGQFQRWLDGHQ